MGKLTTVLKLSGIALFLGMCALPFILSLPTSGWKALSVQTGSMRPAINPGDMVLVNRVPISSLKVGDVITYVNPHNQKQTITHRIIAINGPQITVKGDANRAPDPVVFANSVVGRVKTAVPYLGHGVNFVRTPLGLLALIYIPALAIVISEIRRLSDHYRRMQPYISARVLTRMKGSAGKAKLALAGKLTVFLLVISAAVAIPTYAALTTTATLTGNTISSGAITPPPPPNQCTGGDNTTNTNVNVSGTGNGNTTVDVNNNNDQTASSGNASNNGNTNGGTATSGNASNCNSTNINVNITNNP